MAAGLEPVVQYIRRIAGHEVTRNLTDADLIERFATERNEAAFAALVRRHGRLVLGVCRRVLRQEQDAEDSFQATFVLLAHKAGTIRKRQSAASWLYGVAYRMAMNAKRKAARRRHAEKRSIEETENRGLSGSPTPRLTNSPSPAAEASLHELQAILDEEVSRLPETYRAPFVLCCLEGKSIHEAARELDWKQGTVAGRLAKARKRLQLRLTRRGVALAAVLAANAVTHDSLAAVVPPALAGVTIKAALLSAAGKATAGVLPAAVAGLVKGMSKAMVVAKIKTAMMLVIGASVVAGGAGVFGIHLASGETAGNQQSNESNRAPGKQTKNNRPATAGARILANSATDAQVYQGRVLAPDGKPAAGVRVYLPTLFDYKSAKLAAPPVRATTDADGRFRFAVAAPEFGPRMTKAEKAGLPLMAVAKDYGPGFAKASAAGDVTITLVNDSAPVSGRILDLQGRPVAGVRVGMRAIKVSPKNDLTAWLQVLKSRKEGRDEHEYLPMMAYGELPTDFYPPITTGADGRFTLKHIGVERVVTLLIEAPTIETQEISVMTRRGVPAFHVNFYRDAPMMGKVSYYPPEFDHVAAPCQPIVGTVRDKDTGKPVAGARVVSLKAVGNPTYYPETRTDKDGRYRLTGVPKGEGQRLGIIPSSDQPYPALQKPISQGAGLEPVTIDLELKRGIWLQVKIIDKATGDGDRLAAPEYFLFKDSPILREIAGYQLHYMVNGGFGQDGIHRIAVFPGHGILCTRSPDDKYIMGAGAEKIKENNKQRISEQVLEDGSRLLFFLTEPHLCDPRNLHTLVEINPSRDGESVTLELDPGRTLSGTVLDPDGKPLVGAWARGLKGMGGWEQQPLQTASFTVIALEAGQARTLEFSHESKRLVRRLMIPPAAKGPLNVKLEPAGLVVGRLVDADGQPRRNLKLSCHPALPHRGDVWTDKEGRFRIEPLVPGTKYWLTVLDNFVVQGFVFQNLTVRSGETKDLGDVKAELPKEDTKAEPNQARDAKEAALPKKQGE